MRARGPHKPKQISANERKSDGASPTAPLGTLLDTQNVHESIVCSMRKQIPSTNLHAPALKHMRALSLSPFIAHAAVAHWGCSAQLLLAQEMLRLNNAEPAR